MSEKSERFEKVEDALFALMMNDFMKEQGEYLLELNESLKTEPEDDALATSKIRCQKVIENRFKAKTNVTHRKNIKKAIRVTLVAILTAILLCVTAFAVSNSFRVYVLNLVIEVTDKQYNYRFEEVEPSGEEEDVSVSEFKPGWLPDGYEQTYSESDDFSIFNRYEGKDGGSVSIQKLLGVGAGLAADSEDALIQSITVGGCAAVMVEKDGVCEITWANEDTKTFFVVCTENLPSEVAVKIADNLIY